MDADPTKAAALPHRLRKVFRSLPACAIAFSGGLDSRFLCHAALLCGSRILALHAQGPHIAAQESAEAQDWARRRGLPLRLVHYSPLPLAEVAANSRERCYACKRGLMAALRATLALTGQDAPCTLCDGTNADDMRAFRPGLRALKEAGVRSPLAEAGLTKDDIRRLARQTGLDRPDQRARPCLLTRLAYGFEPTEDLLRRLAAAEAALDALPAPADASAAADAEQGAALGDFRLRVTPEPLLQAQRLPPELRPQVEAILAAHGFAPCTIRLDQDISGFYDTKKIV